MHLFKSNVSGPDLSLDLRDQSDWAVGILRTLPYFPNITAVAIEPFSGLLSIGTSDGRVAIFGRPGVLTWLDLSEPCKVKFLAFSVNLYMLICVDDTGCLYCWDLTKYGRPALVNMTRFKPIAAIAVSPCHTHAFIALESGQIETFDLLNYQKSPYRISQNLYAQFEAKMIASGVLDHKNPTMSVCLDIICHPRDPNLLFIVFIGGVVLYDITQQTTVRVYDYSVPPGARGAVGYSDPHLMQFRRPEVTSAAVHPSGHFFAVGYTDGSIVIWFAGDDEPILARTLEDLDVNIIDAETLDLFLSGSLPEVGQPNREPIFKLVWSGCSDRDERTYLTVLGGGNVGASGLTVQRFPPFQHPANFSAANTENLDYAACIREAIRQGSIPTEAVSYDVGMVQDFVLWSPNNPYFSGTHDARVLLAILDGPNGTRIMEAFEFPPPSLGPSKIASAPVAEEKDEMADALTDMELNRDPTKLNLPGALVPDNIRVASGRLLGIDRERIQLLRDIASAPIGLPLRAGEAWNSEDNQSEIKMIKYHSPRLLVTLHRDLFIRLWDASPQLLMGIPPTSIQTDFPNPLHKATINVFDLALSDSAILQKFPPSFLGEAKLADTEVSTESLDILAILQTGEVVVFRLKDSQVGFTRPNVPDPEIVVLNNTQRDCVYRPLLMLLSNGVPISAHALSDIGFMACAYVDGSLTVVDLRGPKVILRRTSSSKRHSLVHKAPSYITSLTWAISRLDSDPALRVRLIVGHISGSAEVFSLDPSSYAFGDRTITVDGPSNPIKTFVLNAKTGAQLKPTRSQFNSTQNPSSTGESSVFVIVGAKEARCFSDIDGSRLGKADWESKQGAVTDVQIVERNGSHALVAVTEKNKALAYSLPKLENIQTLQLPSEMSPNFTMDEFGDFVWWSRLSTLDAISQAMYGTLFNFRKECVYSTPDIEFGSAKSLPSPPALVNIEPRNTLSSWLPFNLGGGTTGDQIDVILAGPQRPDPSLQKRTNEKNPVHPVNRSTPTQQGSSLYDRLTAAVNERGQMLGDLEEHFQSLEQGSRNMASQAKKMATQQTAKRWLGF